MPHLPPTSRNTLLRIVIRCVCWLGWLSSRPSTLMPALTCRTRLFENVVFDDRPWRPAILVADGKEDGETVLGLRPVALEQVAVYVPAVHS